MKVKLNHFLIFFLLMASGFFGLIFSIYKHTSPEYLPHVDDRVIETFHYPATFVKGLVGDKQAGMKIFKEFCSACHAPKPLIDIQAPHVGDKKVWQGLSSLGMKRLLEITVNGAGAMPARGGCFECSDQQLRETIQYMLTSSK